MMKLQNFQDVFINELRRGKQASTVFLVNGFQIRGTISAFDNFTVLIDTDGKQQLVYKHAISTIVPLRPVRFQTEQNAVEQIGTEK